MTHYQERLDQRINLITSLTVSYESRESVGRYNRVGTIKVSDTMKLQINNTVKQIESTSFNKNSDYAVKVTQLPLNNNTVQFDSEESKNSAKGKNLVASVVDGKGESNGNEIYAIIRGGVITTFCFVKSYTGNQNGLLGKLRVDGIIKKIKNYKKNR